MEGKISNFVTLLLVLALAGSLYFNFNQRQQLQQKQAAFEKKEQTFKTEKKSYRSQENDFSELENEIEKLKYENQVLQNNDKGTKGKTKEFESTTEKLFQALTTFDSSNYSDRKKASEPYLSKELVKKYFDDSLTHGDSNGTESRLNELAVYGQVVQGETMKGIVVSRYESRVSDSGWNEGTDFYEVEYDTSSKKIIKLEYVGKGTTGGLID